MIDALKSPRILLLVLFVIAQAAAIRLASRNESVNAASMAPLSALPEQISGWHSSNEASMEKNIEQILHPDDYIIRDYQDGAGHQVNLFVAYFKTQRTGNMPHSPRNCLPGSGWVPSTSDLATIPTQDGPPITVNQYLVQRGEAKSVVLYWYQTHKRVIASEYWARIYLVLDSISDNRTDTALVRLVSPVIDDDVKAAEQAVLRLAPLIHSTLRDHIPR